MKTEVERTIEFAENMKREGRKEREAEIIEMLIQNLHKVRNKEGHYRIQISFPKWCNLIKQIKEQKE